MVKQVEVKVIPGGVSLLGDGEQVFITAGHQPSEFTVSFRGNGSYEARLSRLLRGLAAPHPVVFVSPLTLLPEERLDCTQHGTKTATLEDVVAQFPEVFPPKPPLEFKEKEAEPAPAAGKKRGRPSKAEAEAKKSETAAYSEGIKEQGLHPAELRALENVTLQAATPPPPVTVVTPEPPPAVEPESPFKAEMADIDARQNHTVAVAGGPPITFHPVEQPLDQIGRLVKLLSEPMMPSDVHPLDLKRSPQDKRMTDSALVRCAFQRYMVAEQDANVNNASYAPQLPPPGDRIVDVSTDEGVAAFVHLLAAVKNRATEMGKEIPQLEAFFAIGDVGFCTQAAVVKVAARRPPVPR
jgi:hypothetical protein